MHTCTCVCVYLLLTPVSPFLNRFHRVVTLSSNPKALPLLLLSQSLDVFTLYLRTSVSWSFYHPLVRRVSVYSVRGSFVPGSSYRTTDSEVLRTRLGTSGGGLSCLLLLPSFRLRRWSRLPYSSTLVHQGPNYPFS